MNTTANSLVIIGSRGSDLALWQANHVKKQLENSGLAAEIKIISTHGDRTQQWNTSFEKLEGKGFFTKELEDALLSGEIHLAVHSHKDLPTESPEGLTIAAISEREDPSELLLVSLAAYDSRQPLYVKKNASVGTSSARRKSQLHSFRDDLVISDLRGNVPTRIKKLREGQYDAIMLAAAGVDRLQIDLSDVHVVRLSPKEFVPAPAQGVLALQIKEDNAWLYEKLQALNNKEVAQQISTERKVLNLFDGGCQLPLGVFCDWTDTTLCSVYVSKAANAVTSPLRLKYVLPKHELTVATAQKIVSAIQHIKPQSVLITRELKENDLLVKTLRENGFAVVAQSFIKTSPIAYAKVITSDWIFFSSKNAVTHFFDQAPSVPATTKFAALSNGTATELKKYVEQVDFIGTGNDTTQIAEQFKKWIGNATVTFPQALNGHRTIQQSFDSTQVTDLTVYETTYEPVELKQAFDIAIFTSPSNVNSFVQLNTFDKITNVMAIGQSTASELMSFTNDVLIPEDFSDLSMLHAVLAIATN